ncbi:hypothetical protein EPN90_04790 [Patescibacteria group bacterium]|nr:MAG: hypothetical protein EPN90_04790 [Patescibacteria group bacterium]
MRHNTAALSPAAAPAPRSALAANILTVLFLVSIPLVGLIAVWTIAPWNRRARLVVSVLFAFPALYPPYLVLSSLIRQAF